MIEHTSALPYADARPTRFRVLVNGNPLMGQQMTDLRSEDVALRIAREWKIPGNDVRIETLRLNDDGTPSAMGKWQNYHG